MSFVAVLESIRLPDGSVVVVDVEGRRIAVARDDGKLYAFEDRCSHQDCPLSTGIIEGGTVECESHGAIFDLETGAVVLPPAERPIAVFRARELDGAIEIDAEQLSLGVVE